MAKKLVKPVLAKAAKRLATAASVRRRKQKRLIAVAFRHRGEAERPPEEAVIELIRRASTERPLTRETKRKLGEAIALRDRAILDALAQ